MACHSCQSGVGSSPLTRGKRPPYPVNRLPMGLIPAHAGKTWPCPDAAGRPGAHPRSRGENGDALIAAVNPTGSSPLTRGKLAPPSGRGHHRVAHPRSRGENAVERRATRHRERLIPAHAGKTGRSESCPHPRPAHPRSRGENLTTFSSRASLLGSSPLTRGKPEAKRLLDCPARLIPAHAGKTTCWAGAHGCGGAHPRSRGENPRHHERNAR